MDRYLKTPQSPQLSEVLKQNFDFLTSKRGSVKNEEKYVLKGRDKQTMLSIPLQYLQILGTTTEQFIQGNDLEKYSAKRNKLNLRSIRAVRG